MVISKLFSSQNFDPDISYLPSSRIRTHNLSLLVTRSCLIKSEQNTKDIFEIENDM